MAGGADDAEANVDLEEKREDDDDVQGEEMRRRKALSDAQRGPLPRLSFPPGTTAGTKIQEKEKYVKKLRRDYRHSLLKGEVRPFIRYLFIPTHLRRRRLEERMPFNNFVMWREIKKKWRHN